MLIQHVTDRFDGVSGLDVRKLLVSKGCHILQEISDWAAVLNKGSLAQPRGLFCLVIKEKASANPPEIASPTGSWNFLMDTFPVSR